MPPPEDEYLIEGAMRGDEWALDQLFRRYYDTMNRFAQKICPDQSDAEDIAQDAFIKLMGSIRTFDRRSAFTSWLYRVVLNKAIDFRRHKTRRGKLTDDLRLVLPDKGEATQETNVTARQVVDIILDFPDRERDAALLVLGEGLTHAQAAEVIGCPTGTIGWLLNKVSTKLNALLEAEDHEPDQVKGPVRHAGDPAAVVRG